MVQQFDAQGPMRTESIETPTLSGTAAQFTADEVGIIRRVLHELTRDDWASGPALRAALPRVPTVETLPPAGIEYAYRMTILQALPDVFYVCERSGAGTWQWVSYARSSELTSHDADADAHHAQLHAAAHAENAADELNLEALGSTGTSGQVPVANGAGGVTLGDHGSLAGKGDDDHTQYLNTSRHTALGGGHVTNGDSHNHLGGDGGQIAHSSLSGVTGDHVTNGNAHDHNGGDGGTISHNSIGSINANQHHNENHASRHADGGGDELTVENLATSGAAGTVPTSDGAGGLTMSAAGAWKVISQGAIAASTTGFNVTSGFTGYKRFKVILNMEANSSFAVFPSIQVNGITTNYTAAGYVVPPGTGDIMGSVSPSYTTSGSSWYTGTTRSISAGTLGMQAEVDIGIVSTYALTRAWGQGNFLSVGLGLGLSHGYVSLGGSAITAIKLSGSSAFGGGTYTILGMP